MYILKYTFYTFVMTLQYYINAKHFVSTFTT